MSTVMQETENVARAVLPKTPILITAATKWEAKSLVKALGLAQAAPGRYEGTVGSRPVILLRTGIGAKKTTDKLNELTDNNWLLVISAGLCGSLQKNVRHGDIVADVREVALEFVGPLRETAASQKTPFHFGKILHTNVVLKPAAKRALGEEQRAIACDMETASVRRWADERFAAIGVRVVLDDLDEEIPSEAPESEDAASLARFALAHAASLPSLIRTGYRSARAMKTLGRYLTAYLEAI